jgi:catalase
LGGPNFHEIPINASVAPVHNNTRDGLHRQAVHRGRVSYEPNSLGGGCPFQAGKTGFVSYPERIADDKVRGNPEKFAEHYNQATLFYESQSEVEKAHIVRAFRFELTKVQTPSIRERVVAMLSNVSKDLAGRVADGLGIPVPDPLPKAAPRTPKPEVKVSTALSLLARPGDGSVRTRRIAILVADGVDAEVTRLHETYSSAGAVPRYVGAQLGTVRTSGGKPIHVEVTMEAMPAVLFDALIVPAGEEAIKTLSLNALSLEFVKDQYRHCKAILAIGEGKKLLDKCGIPRWLPDGESDAALITADNAKPAVIAEFTAAIGKHRNLARYADPPLI